MARVDAFSRSRTRNETSPRNIHARAGVRDPGDPHARPALHSSSVNRPAASRSHGTFEGF